LAIVVAVLLVAFSEARAAVVFTATHKYDVPALSLVDAVDIKVTVLDNYLGDFSKYQWVYDVTNNSYDPPGGNGFSGFETALPIPVPDLGDVAAPGAIPPWIIDGFSGARVEWDLHKADGLGVMPGATGTFSFTSLPRLITNSTGWFHTWTALPVPPGGETQSFITFYSDTPGAVGPEVPDVVHPPTRIPEPGALAIWGVLGLIGFAAAYRRRRKP
jgi:hypothetical protein